MAFSRKRAKTWLRDLNERNWQNYTFSPFPWWRPIKLRRPVEWFFRHTRDETSIWKDFVIYRIVRDQETGAYYLCHEVAAGYGGDHYPRCFYHHIPISAEEVAQLEKAGLLEPSMEHIL